MSSLLLGLTFGLSAGLTPGPLLTLVITASLQRGWSAGILVAVSPFITDAPIIAIAILLLDRLPPWALAVVTVLGGMLMIYMGVDGILSARRAELPATTDQNDESDAAFLWRGALVNALNPHPYLFWATIGGPTLLSAWQQRPLYGIAFMLGFYLLLVGSKVLLAGVVASQTMKLPLMAYRWLLGILGLAMGGLGVYLLADLIVGLLAA